MRYSSLRYPGFRSKAVTLSYDDGTISDRKLIEIMSKYGLKGTFNVNAGYFRIDPKYHKLIGEEAAALYTSTGNELAAHGYYHQSLAKLDEEAVRTEIMTDRVALEKIMRAPVQGMAYANGSYSELVMDILQECGIVYARTTRSTEAFDLPEHWLTWHPTCRHANPRLMELAETFLSTPDDRAQLFYLWGHSSEFQKDNNWHIMEEFASFVGNRTNIWYATNMEIYNYVKAYNNLQFAADHSFVHNPGMTDVYVNCHGQDILIPSDKIVFLQ